ncbi:MAG: hypothetical protein JNM56_05700 [Planctomycetia bacterium]|nr:hypothetical protein [Planctomycetia bacterium]
MKEAIFTIEEAARCLPSLVQRVHSTGETALLVQAGEPMVRIVAIPMSEPPKDDLISFLRRWRLEHPEPDEQPW